MAYNVCIRRQYPTEYFRANAGETLFRIWKIRRIGIQDGPRLNERIRISPIRLVNAEGEMIGEMATAEALQMAAEAGLDLVEVSPDARPPVCRIMDFGKVQYERRKKQTAGTKPQRNQQLKQIRLRAKTGQHDIDFKVNQARTFLERKDKVKVNVLFRGRENAHHNRGREMLLSIIETLADIATVERPPGMESGRSMTMTLIPKS
jgi:translation initiation factor IF-3